MKFSAVILAAFAAAVYAAPQDSTPVSSATTPQASCLSGCGLTDLKCQASCVGVPYPNEDDANATTKCAEGCEQGDGSPQAAVDFGNCVQDCIKQNFPMGPQSASPSGTKPTGASPSNGGMSRYFCFF